MQALADSGPDTADGPSDALVDALAAEPLVDSIAEASLAQAMNELAAGSPSPARSAGKSPVKTSAAPAQRKAVDPFSSRGKGAKGGATTKGMGSAKGFDAKKKEKLTKPFGK